MFPLKRKRCNQDYIINGSRSNLISIIPARDDYLKDSLLFETQLESFVKKMIERQTALSIQNAMDISDMISPNVGIASDALKLQVLHSTNDPCVYVENLLGFLRGEFAGDIIKNNIILRNMKDNQIKSLEIIRKCILEDTMSGDFTYDLFDSCIIFQSSREDFTTNSHDFLSNNPYRYQYQHQYLLPKLDSNETLIITKDEADINTDIAADDDNDAGADDDADAVDDAGAGADDDADAVDDAGAGAVDDDNNNDQHHDTEPRRTGNRNENNTEMYIINSVVEKLKSIFNNNCNIRNTTNKDNNDCYFYNHVKNIYRKSYDIIVSGEYLSCDHYQPLEGSFFTFDYNTSKKSMERLVIQLEDMVHRTFSKGESQLSSIEEITVLRLFLKNILLLKTATLVNQYRLFLSFIVTYSLSHNLSHNVRLYFQKNRMYNCRFSDTTDTENDDKFILVKLNNEDSVFILSLLAHFLGPCVETFLCPANLYDTAINFVDSVNSEWGKNYINISVQIKRILDQLTARETFLKEREQDKSVNTVIHYVVQNTESDILLNPLHCIIADIGKVMELLADRFRDLFRRTISILHIISKIIITDNK
uniref:Wsv308-like protein n=1 Tax=Melicertus latisulcatus majanivirus TaxID=2984277 RepID=A0A9C7F7W6_9VIRU|nr:MAG: wsv308-like protein [Melicertus latisulcatus majanivirus]